MDPGRALERRISRLQLELQDELDLELTDEALEELAFCRFVEPHEGRRPAYGAVIWTSELPAVLGGVPPLPSAAGFIDSDAPLDVLRNFADGRISFVIRGPGIVPALAVDPAWTGSESVLAAYASEADVTVVQRLASGRVRLYINERVYSEEGGIWLARPTARAYYEQVAALVDVVHRDTVRAILDMCVHTLSPAGHGATLVWFPEPPGGSTARHLDCSVAITPPALSAANSTHGPAIAHALGQMDRAAIIDSDGNLSRLNVALGYGQTEAALTFNGGTRHNSAGRYSASEDRALVFVVSADGPVTVFNQGLVIAAIH